MANGKQLSQKGAEEILDIIDSYIDVKEAVESTKNKPFNNYHSKEEQELNLYNALTDYCDM